MTAPSAVSARWSAIAGDGCHRCGATIYTTTIERAKTDPRQDSYAILFRHGDEGGPICAVEWVPDADEFLFGDERLNVRSDDPHEARLGWERHWEATIHGTAVQR